jgi:hypothetical protein
VFSKEKGRFNNKTMMMNHMDKTAIIVKQLQEACAR